MPIKIYKSSEGIHRFSISTGVLSVFIQKDGRATGVLCDATKAPADYLSIVNSLHNGIAKTELECKVIGVGASPSDFHKQLGEAGFVVKNAVERPTGTNVVLDSNTGKVWLEKKAETSAGKVKVLIVDDSATIRQLLTRVLGEDPGIEILGAAEGPSQALEMIRANRPDVMTLDVHMPEMDGLTFLKKVFPIHKIPTVMITSVGLAEGRIVLDALEAGAVDYIQKPSFEALKELTPLIIEKVKTAARATAQAATAPRVGKRTTVGTEALDPDALIAIGASTGGTEALRQVLTSMPSQIPPVVIVQHIPAVFSKAFADRMNELCEFEVREAADGDVLKPNLVLIAPGGFQMKVKQFGAELKIRIEDAAPVNRHKPSVDFLFDSLIPVKGRKITGAILTGMGADGARGLLKLKEAGYWTCAQDEKTCVVFGMPREAIALGAAAAVLPLSDIGPALISASALRQGKDRKAS